MALRQRKTRRRHGERGGHHDDKAWIPRPEEIEKGQNFGGTRLWPTDNKSSKPPRQRQAHRERFGGMDMPVGDAADHLARQS